MIPADSMTPAESRRIDWELAYPALFPPPAPPRRDLSGIAAFAAVALAVIAESLAWWFA